MQLKSGTLLQGGKYRIERVLGKGGFGITYLAYQKGLNRYVAVKEFFMSDYCNREESTCAVSIPSVGSREMVEKYRSKFVKEAQTIAELDNKHIVPIFDVFEENGTAYYVMKYIGGGSLSSLVKKGETLSLDVALKYVRQVADALAYCHERNIAHLDVKPGNILIQDGMAILIDFGISKHYNEGGDQTSSTPVGISKGYAPLEQYKKGGVTTFSPVTDIYSLGAVLFRLVTGQTPPDADEVNEEGLPEFPSDVPQYIQDAITAAMQPKKKDRPQSVEEFLSLLKDPEPVSEEVDKDDTEDTELEGEELGDTEKKEIKKQVIHWIDIKEFLNENRAVFRWHPTKKYRHFVCGYVIFAALLSCLFIVLAVLFDTDWCLGFFVWCPALFLRLLCILPVPEFKTKSLIYDVEYLDEYFVRKGNKGISYSFRIRSIGGKLGLCILIRYLTPNLFWMEPILEIEYDDIIKINEKTFICRRGKTYGLFRYTFPHISSKDNWVLSMEYDMIEVLPDNNLRVVKGDKSYKYTVMGYRVVE